MTQIDSSRSFGIGPTKELSLRVSVATLARIVFPRPENGELMLALEHKATLLTHGAEPHVLVKAQPFGGAIRILNFARLQALIGNFHFDSERSRSEKDFRLFIRPSDWPDVRDFCLSSFRQQDDSDLEADPKRELVEEFDDAIGIDLRSDQYIVAEIGTVVENEPVLTGNIHAAGKPTVRVYKIFEAQITDFTLSQAIVVNSEKHSSDVLRSLAVEDSRKGGRGRANGMLVISMQRIRDFYLAISPHKRGELLSYENTRLEGNVPVVLDDIYIPKYQYGND